MWLTKIPRSVWNLSVSWDCSWEAYCSYACVFIAFRQISVPDNCWGAKRCRPPCCCGQALVGAFAKSNMKMTNPERTRSSERDLTSCGTTISLHFSTLRGHCPLHARGWEWAGGHWTGSLDFLTTPMLSYNKLPSHRITEARLLFFTCCCLYQMNYKMKIWRYSKV